MSSSSVVQLPPEIWIDIATALRDLPPHVHYEETHLPLTLRCWYTGYHHPIFCFAPTNTRIYPLSTTSRFLHRTLEPLLYETIAFQQWDRSFNAEALVRTLTNRPDLLRHVRTLVLYRLNYYHIHVQSAVELLLPHLNGVRCVAITSSNITLAITQMLVNAINLQALFIDGCKWTDEVPSGWSENRFGGRLRELMLRTGLQGEPGCDLNLPRYDQLFVPSLDTLDIELEFLRSREPFMLSESSTFAGLTHLVISLSWNTASIFDQLLGHATNIEDLQILDFFNEAQHFEITQDSLPRLRSFTGPLNYARRLAGRHSIERLHIQHVTDARPNFYFNPDCAVPFPALRTLILEKVICNERSMEAIVDQYPHLTHLVIHAKKPLTSWIEMHVIPLIGRLPHLQLLRLAWNEEYYPSDATMDEEVSYPLSDDMLAERAKLQAVWSVRCPELREVRISPGNSWYRHRDGWMPVVRRFHDTGP